MVRTSLLITFLRYQRKLPSRVFLRPDRIEFHLKRGEREKSERVWRQLEPVRSIGRALEEILLKDDRNPKEWKTVLHREESSATRCSTVKWERAGVSAREEHGALKAQSGYNSGQGRKAAVSKPPRILREEIRSFFRFAPEITFRHLLEKKGEGWSLESFRFRVMIHSSLTFIHSSFSYPRKAAWRNKVDHFRKADWTFRQTNKCMYKYKFGWKNSRLRERGLTNNRSRTG